MSDVNADSDETVLVARGAGVYSVVLGVGLVGAAFWVLWVTSDAGACEDTGAE